MPSFFALNRRIYVNSPGSFGRSSRLTPPSPGTTPGTSRCRAHHGRAPSAGDRPALLRRVSHYVIGFVDRRITLGASRSNHRSVTAGWCGATPSRSWLASCLYGSARPSFCNLSSKLTFVKLRRWVPTRHPVVTHAQQERPYYNRVKKTKPKTFAAAAAPNARRFAASESG